MKSVKTFWASRTTRCNGPNPIKLITTDGNGRYWYFNDGFKSTGDGSPSDFELEYGCIGFDDHAYELSTSDMVKLDLQRDSFSFQIANPREFFAKKNEDLGCHGLMQKRVVIYMCDRNGNRNQQIAVGRVVRQFQIGFFDDGLNEHWAFVCDVLHYYENHLFEDE